MADVHGEIIQSLWYATPESSWSSLKKGLNEILVHGVIDTQQYEDIQYAISKLEKLNVDFPVSYTELHERLDHYM